VAIAVLGQVDFKYRRSAADKWAARIDTRPGAAGGERTVQDRRMRRVDATFERLQPVALLDHFGHVAVAGWRLGELEPRRSRRLVRRPHIRPDNPAQLEYRIVLDVDLVLEAVFSGLVELVDTV